MEFLIFWKAHYMDAWDQQKVDGLSADMKAKYDRRYQKGDVVEVREDGYWATRGFDKEAFCVVKVPGMAYDATKMNALYDDDIVTVPNAKVLARREWSFPVAKIPAAIKLQMDSEKAVTITLANFQSLDVLTRAQRSAYVADTAKLVSKGG